MADVRKEVMRLMRIDEHIDRVNSDMTFGRFDNHKIAYRAMIAAAKEDGK